MRNEHTYTYLPSEVPLNYEINRIITCPCTANEKFDRYLLFLESPVPDMGVPMQDINYLSYVCCTLYYDIVSLAMRHAKATL